ncbi:hypothetical protein [Dehalobacter sp. TeCB1]|uniref:hypothetical protein n=1 Tax=Dehalobacter sp. TeCB1 TaxID=1843715 RepID=UPI0011472964|nr:hypothetical protein [Dehalobacter sp. TeCB1]
MEHYLSNPETPLIISWSDVLPNAFYFARHVSGLSGFYYLYAAVHGDFHGDNVFLAQSGKDYAVIDWALAREDGFLFFDSAYFELSLLLRSLESYSLKDWVENIKNICEEKWDKLNFTDAVIIEAIHKTENNWINTVNDASFSHVDKMKYSRYIARMLAGLNFSGKRKIDSSKKEKAFLFSCIFLKKLFATAQYEDWQTREIERWNTIALGSRPDTRTVTKLAQHCTQFSEQYQYILISGSNPVSSDLTNEYLARIPWRGIISLSNKVNEVLYTKISEVKQLRNLLLNQKSSDMENNIQHSAVWWMFADGFESDPSTLTDKFAQWRNKYSGFLQNAISKICSFASPQDLMLIIDCGSFAKDKEWDKVQQILEWFDQNESADIGASLLTLDPEKGFEEERLANITLRPFNMNMEYLAYYASTYLSGGSKTGIWLPHIEKKIGVQLEEADVKYITSYLEIIGDHLLNSSADIQSRRAFYWGESITWDAIDSKILVDRPEVQDYVKKIKKKIENEKWGLINLGHTPGAGATVLGKSICWQLRKDYPTVQIRQIGNDLFESFKRIANHTGSPIIILADGDFTRGEINTIETALKANLVKFIILYTYRVYGGKNGDSSDILTCLDIPLAENFEFRYIEEMRLKGAYSNEQLEARKEQLRNLTRNVNLTEFRLPFFYGMYTFEEDFVSMSEYTNQIISFMKQKPEYQKIVSYIAIITYFTSKNGLSHKVAKKILSMSTASIRKLLSEFDSHVSNFIYVTGNTYRICHPIIAFKILTTQFGTGNSSLSTLQFSNICKDFIKDIRKMEGGVLPSEYANKLIADIFVTRGFVDSTDSSAEESKDAFKKRSFAPIILSIGNENLQKEVFACLVEQFPDNPHCFQHYGRLLISNTPSDIVTAKQQFDKAIKLDGKNPFHYHARGTMYQKHCRYLLDSKLYDTMDPMDVYNGCKTTVELALTDFEKAVDLARRDTQDSQTGMTYLLPYPYSSILYICTLIIRTIMDKYGLKYDIKQFWEMKTDVTRWCCKLLAMANKYDFETENVHPEVSGDDFYRVAKNNLMKIKLDPVKIQKLIELNPDENSFKIVYLSSVDTHREAMRKKSQIELSTIQNYCEVIITTSEPDGGIIWKWFNAYIRMGNFNYTHALGFLETLSNTEDNITVNFLLQIIYFCKFLKTDNRDDADRALKYQVRCKELGRNNPHRRSARCFLTDSGIVPLTTEKETAAKFSCTILEEVTKEQSAEMSLDMDTRFKVFFVPYHNKVIKVGQSFSQKVNATIGFSYSGLRGFELESR